jgi:hypothetical protein
MMTNRTTVVIIVFVVQNTEGGGGAEVFDGVPPEEPLPIGIGGAEPGIDPPSAGTGTVPSDGGGVAPDRIGGVGFPEGTLDATIVSEQGKNG